MLKKEELYFKKEKMNEYNCPYCKKIFNLDKENNKKDKYLSCPYCLRFCLNPYYEGEE